MTKTIFITGGSRGIGEALVRLAAGKYNVAFTYCKNEAKSNVITQELAEFGGVLAIPCDVRDRNSVLSAIETAKNRFGKIDILVNNAGVSCDKLLIDMTAEDWRDCFSVNVDGVFNVTQAVLPDMLLRKSGSIVNLSSVWGRYGASGEVAYSAAKAAVIGFTKALAKEVALCGVRVNAVAPGAINTDMMKAYTEDEVSSLIRDSIPLGRLGKAEEVAKTILFVAESEYMSGAVIAVDGLLC